MAELPRGAGGGDADVHDAGEVDGEVEGANEPGDATHAWMTDETSTTTSRSGATPGFVMPIVDLWALAD